MRTTSQHCLASGTNETSMLKIGRVRLVRQECEVIYAYTGPNSICWCPFPGLPRQDAPPPLPCDLGRGDPGQDPPNPGSPNPTNHRWEDRPFLETVLGNNPEFLPLALHNKRQHADAHTILAMSFHVSLLGNLPFFGHKEMCTSALLCFAGHEAHLLCGVILASSTFTPVLHSST